VPGRKRDISDCQWIAELHEFGLLRASFIPAAEVAALRQRTRYQPLSRDAVELLVARHARAAQTACPTLAAKTLSPHVLRHTAVICTASDPMRDVGSAA
jgi:hypothetical protein